MRIFLLGILLAAFVIRFYNLNYNTAFLDEAQYITVGLHILKGETEVGIAAFPWIGGYPFLYPVITAGLYNIGGIVGSRLFTVVLGTASVFLMYQLTKQLLFFKDKKSNQIAGLMSAAFMTVTAMAVITSRTAIYDGLAFPLFLFGIVLFHKALYSGEKLLYFSSAVVLFLSFLAKYIVLIYFPFLLLMPIIVAVKMKRLDCLRGIILSFCLPFALLVGLYIGINFADLKDFFIDQGVLSTVTQGKIARTFFEYTGVAYLLFFFAMALLWRNDKFLFVVLLILSYIPLIAHTLTGNNDSTQQHTIFALMFLLPGIGAGFAYLFQKNKIIGSIFICIALVTQVLVSLPQVKNAETFWPNITGAANAIREDLDPSDRVLSEADDSMYLELKENIPQEQISGPFVFSYASNSASVAYTEAIQNKYFQFVQIDGTFFDEKDIQLFKKLMDKKYRLIYDNRGVLVYEVMN